MSVVSSANLINFIMLASSLGSKAFGCLPWVD